MLRVYTHSHVYVVESVQAAFRVNFKVHIQYLTHFAVETEPVNTFRHADRKFHLQETFSGFGRCDYEHFVAHSENSMD